MKVLMLSDANSTHTKKWVSGLLEKGVDIVVFSLRKPNDLFYESLSVHCYSIDLFAGKNSSLFSRVAYLMALPKLYSVLKKEKPQILHAHYATSYGLLGRLCFFKPFMITVWGSDVLLFPEKGSVFKKLVSWILNGAGLITSASRVMGEKVRTLSSKKVEIVPFGVDTNLFSPVVSEKPAGLVIGTVKSLEPVYGIDILIRTFAELLKQTSRTDLQLTIIGDGTQKEALTELCSTLKVEKYVNFKGRINNQLLPQEYANFDLAAFFSRSESFGVSVVEAAACGVPSIVTPIGGLVEVVTDGQTGWILNDTDPINAANLLKGILSDELEIKQRGVLAREKAVREFDEKICLDRMLTCYQLLIGQTPSK